VDGLELPSLLVELIDSGRWRSDREQSITGERVLALFPDAPWDPTLEPFLHLERPPFHTVVGERARVFWDHPMAAPAEIDHARAVVIGDFGIGSDTPIVLDYSANPAAPSVRRLEWKFLGGGGPDGRHLTDNHWVTVTPTFEEFARRLALE